MHTSFYFDSTARTRTDMLCNLYLLEITASNLFEFVGIVVVLQLPIDLSHALLGDVVSDVAT